MKDEVVEPLLIYLRHVIQTKERMKSANTINILYYLKNSRRGVRGQA